MMLSTPGAAFDFVYSALSYKTCIYCRQCQTLKVCDHTLQRPNAFPKLCCPVQPEHKWCASLDLLHILEIS